MSNRPCNLCDWQQFQRESKKKGVKVRLVSVPDEHWPEQKQMQEFVDGRWIDRKIWYMKVPDKCAC